MGPVRGLSILKVKSDYQSATDVVLRSCEVARSLDGVISWEMFGHPETGVFVLDESWESEDALVQYEQSITQAGLRPDLESNFTLDFDFALTQIENPQIVAMMKEFGSIQATAIASK